MAGGDLCLICHKEEFVTRSFAEIERAFADRTFAKRASESVERVLAFKKRSPGLRRWAKPPAKNSVERLSRRLWEFGEQVRLETIRRQEFA